MIILAAIALHFAIFPDNKQYATKGQIRIPGEQLDTNTHNYEIHNNHTRFSKDCHHPRP